MTDDDQRTKLMHLLAETRRRSACPCYRYFPDTGPLRLRDPAARSTFEAVLKDGASATAKATTARLLASATGLNDQLRAWCEAEVRRQVTLPTGPEHGFDLVANQVRCVADSLLDAITSQG